MPTLEHYKNFLYRNTLNINTSDSFGINSGTILRINATNEMK